MTGNISYSSSAEDLIVARYFPPDYVGTYVDVGCWRPIEASNTYYFYQKGWRGLCIDAADHAADYAETRPQDVFVQSGVGIEKGALPYYSIAADPSSNTFDKNQAETLKKERGFDYTEQLVRVLPLTDILTAQKIDHIDFLNIDIEGLDLAVLQQFDFNRYKPRVIAIEDLTLDLHNPISSPIVTFLQQQGYLFHSKCYCTSIFVWPLTAAEKAKFEQAQHNTSRVVQALNNAG